MLGLRKYLGTSIDLWQGEVAQFVCDALVLPGEHFGKAASAPAGDLPAKWLIQVAKVEWLDGKSSEISKLMESYLACLNLTEVLGVRHVSVPVFDFVYGEPALEIPRKLVAETAIRATRSFIEVLRELSLPVKRITLAALDGRSYELLQEALYREFPEDLK